MSKEKNYNDEFYIGYLSRAPKEFSRFTKRIVLLLFILNN